MKLPFPDTRAGWFAGVLLTLTLFSWYYQSLYENIYYYYNQQYTNVEIQGFKLRCDSILKNSFEDYWDSGVASVISASVGTGNDYDSKKMLEQCQDQMWSLKLRIPNFTYFATPGWIYGELKNEDTIKSQNATLVINYSGEIISLLPSMYKEDTFVRRIELGEILPGNTVFWRTKFGSNIIGDEDECNAALRSAFWLNSKEVDMQSYTNLTCPKTDIEKAFLRSVTENLLLPPWSNTLIPAISLFLCALLEPGKKERDERPVTTKIMTFAWESIRTYAFSLLASFGIVRMLMDLVLKNNTVTTTLDDYTKFISDLFYMCLILVLFYLVFFFGSKIKWDLNKWDLKKKTKQLMDKFNKKST